ncbi:MAG: hypothetical protein NC337_11400 [Roseburia sp.]|nr:hypothetical protein [Roseburia sp.]
MGKQFHFAMDETDENLFMKYLRENRYAIYMKHTHKMPEITQQLPSPLADGGLTLYIYHPAWGEMKFSNYVHDGKKINFIDPTIAPVIEFGRTIVRHEKRQICSGRIWMQMKYWNENEEFVSKSENLDKGYKIIKNWITKNLQKMNFEYANGTREKCIISKELVKLFEEEGYHW